MGRRFLLCEDFLYVNGPMHLLIQPVVRQNELDRSIIEWGLPWDHAFSKCRAPHFALLHYSPHFRFSRNIVLTRTLYAKDYNKGKG